MEPENVAINLRLLADKNKREAEFFELAAKLQEQGYQTDKVLIEEEVQKDKDTRSEYIAELENKVAEQMKTIETITSEKNTLQVRVDDLTLATEDSKKKLTDMVTIISEVLNKVLPE